MNLPQKIKKKKFWQSASLNVIAKVDGLDKAAASLEIEDVEEPSEDYSYSSQNLKDPFIAPLLSDLLAKEEIPLVICKIFFIRR